LFDIRFKNIIKSGERVCWIKNIPPDKLRVL
jgi:hypothetical protein